MGYLIRTRCGSVPFNLSTKDSDIDQIAMLLPSELPDLEPGDRRVITYPDNGDGHRLDIYEYRIDSYLDPEFMGSTLFTPCYDQVVDGTDTELVQFFKDNAGDLTNIYPEATYNSASRIVANTIRNEQRQLYHEAIRLMGYIYCGFMAEDLVKARELDDDWRSFYQRVHEMPITRMYQIREDMASRYRMVFSNITIRDYYRSCKRNDALIESFQNQVKRIIDSSRIQ